MSPTPRLRPIWLSFSNRPHHHRPLCASGILIRAIGPHLSNKRNEPPVVAVAEDGSVCRAFAWWPSRRQCTARRRSQQLTNGHAAITTASEVRFGFALDDILPGYTLANPDDVKSATAALLAGAPLALLRRSQRKPGPRTAVQV